MKTAKLIFSILPIIFLTSFQKAGPEITFEELGEIKPRSTHDIKSSPWSVGGETMDRDYTIYANWKEYVEPLGVKKVRLQGGWNKTEKELGKYDWQWLDEVIFDLDKKGVSPWVCLSYGNSLYAEGGGTLLGAALPKTDEAINGWLNWVSAFVERYKGVVNEWEIWNEPNLRNVNMAADYANILMKTAKKIREIQADATIIGMSTAGVDIDFVRDVLQKLKEHNMLSYLDKVSYHPYSMNPDKSYDKVMELREVVNSFDASITLFQGENGAPSSRRSSKALRNYDWTETSQAKWALRRMLGDLGHDIPSSIFSIIDMKYPDEMNTKGLLAAKDDKTVDHKKQSYFAVQNLAAVFDNQVKRMSDFKYTSSADRKLSAFAYHKKKAPIVTLWFSDDTPSDSFETTPVDFTFENLKFKKPVLVDLLSGKIYKIPQDSFKDKNVFESLPVYDSPVLITEEKMVL